MTRQQQIERLSGQFVEWDWQIHELQDQLEHADPRNRRQYQDELRALEDKWHAVGKRLARLRLDEAESWREDNFLTGLHEVFDEIGRRVDHAISKMSQRKG